MVSSLHGQPHWVVKDSNSLSFSMDSSFVSAIEVEKSGVVPGCCLVAEIFSISLGLNFAMFARWWSDVWCFLIQCFVVCKMSGEMGWVWGPVAIQV